jgi:hypothetical protein
MTDKDNRMDFKQHGIHTPPIQAILDSLNYDKRLLYLVLLLMGSESKGLDANTVILEALRKLRKSRKELLSSDAISGEVKADVLEKTASLVQDIFQASQKHIPFEETLQQKAQALQQKGDIFVHQPKPVEQPPDLSDIPLWRGRKQDGKPLDFLEAHYRQWLSRFGAPEDAVYMDQIHKHDPKLLQGVRNQLREEGKGDKPRDFIKPRSARIDRELANVTVEDLKKNTRLASTFHTRHRRAAEANVTAPSRSVTRKK